ncbi:hypothetical protein [Streptomyces sp. NPDC088727]|uniref:hypothetical protein n=1 Tax=Streptomyces sp. NPDC088727 TaxID=3365875 RepID=UPI00382B13B7
MRGQLTGLLQLHGCRFGYGTLLGHPPRLQQDGTVTSGHSHWDVDQLGLPDQEVELRTLASGHFYGRFMMRPARGAAPSLQARLVAVTLANQVGAALNTARPARGQQLSTSEPAAATLVGDLRERRTMDSATAMSQRANRLVGICAGLHPHCTAVHRLSTGVP